MKGEDDEDYEDDEDEDDEDDDDDEDEVVSQLSVFANHSQPHW